jgi:N-acetylmuramoyl-L-alanine amidase
MYVCIDAGHGGPDAGVSGYGAAEKWIAGEVAARAGEMLHTAGCLVFLTRVGDRKISLPQRVRAAQDTGADLLLSLHCAHSPWSAQRGLGLFYPGGDTRSQAWAELVLRSAESRLNGRTIARGAHPIHWHQRSVAFGLLRAVHHRMPACLVELGYLSNPLDAWLLQERFFLDTLARGLTLAVLEWRRQWEQPLLAPEEPHGHGGGTRAPWER